MDRFLKPKTAADPKALAPAKVNTKLSAPRCVQPKPTPTPKRTPTAKPTLKPKSATKASASSPTPAGAPVAPSARFTGATRKALQKADAAAARALAPGGAGAMLETVETILSGVWFGR